MRRMMYYSDGTVAVRVGPCVRIVCGMVHLELLLHALSQILVPFVFDFVSSDLFFDRSGRYFMKARSMLN